MSYEWDTVRDKICEMDIIQQTRSGIEYSNKRIMIVKDYFFDWYVSPLPLNDSRKPITNHSTLSLRQQPEILVMNNDMMAWRNGVSDPYFVPDDLFLFVRSYHLPRWYRENLDFLVSPSVGSQVDSDLYLDTGTETVGTHTTSWQRGVRE